VSGANREGDIREADIAVQARLSFDSGRKRLAEPEPDQ
jgi:hypothetical protein